MVQRKEPSKLCIRTGHLMFETRVGKLRSSSPRSSDGQAKRSEMKRKMKKSKVMKPSDISSCLKSANFVGQVPQPGEPPPPPPVNKQQQSPNYMKSTSSFEARKELLKVTSQASTNGKSLMKNSKSSKLGSNSALKPARTSDRTSSLKRVSTLTKISSFKPARAASRKSSSQVVFCTDLNSQRATCSSTLKDSNFPNHLGLSQGATESDGTSLMKVCPYAYCSLNGRRHDPLPPLKCFLLAKRRALKTQTGKSLGHLLPRKTEPSGDLEKEICTEMVDNGKAAIGRQDFSNLDINPGVHEEDEDFYVEIYVKNRGDDSENASLCKENGHGAADEDGKVAQSLSKEEPISETGFGDDCSEVISAITDGDFIAAEEQMGKDAEEFDSAKSNQEEGTPEIGSNQSENGADYESYEMEREEGQHPTLSMNAEVRNPAEGENGYGSDDSSSFSANDPSFHNDSLFNISCFEKIPIDEIEIRDNETKSISNEEDETAVAPVEDVDNSSKPQQEEINENRANQFIRNKDQVFEIDDCGEVFAEYVLADTENSAANKSLEQDMEEIKEDDANESAMAISSFDLLGNLSGDNQDMMSDEASDEKCVNEETQTHPPYDLSNTKDFVEDRIDPDKDIQMDLDKVIIIEEIHSDITEMGLGYSYESHLNRSFTPETEETKQRAKTASTRSGGHSNEALKDDKINFQIIKHEGLEEGPEEEREFNPREPNYLPVKPEPEAEKVDLRHQDLDGRKNTEEWMLDYALRQTVNMLAPARKRKVALLVEAFEKVMPPKYDPSLRHSSLSQAFASSRSIQACS